MTTHLLVLGGTGRTGCLVIEKALARGLAVTALARRPEAITLTDPKLTVLKGTPTAAEDVLKALEGCDAVISTLNNARASDSPFAKPINSATMMTDSINNTIAAMSALGVRRIATLGAVGVGDSFMETPWIMRMMINHTNLSHAYRDHNTTEAALAASGLDWTVARAVMLGKKPGKGPIIESFSNQPKPAMQISRASVAEYLLDSLDNAALHAKTPTISQK